VPDTLDLDTWSEVDRWAEGAIHWEFRQPSQLTRGGARLQEFIRSLDIDSRSRDPLSMVRHVMSAIVEQFEYAPQSTGVDTPVDHVIEIRRGVCQDFSHIMIATLRSVGLPARYMSGYLAPSEAALPGPTSIATHAWVEVCLPQLGWVGVDPTHNTVTGTRHVRVAIGRDYADVPPTRGVFKGRAAGALHVSVNIASAERPDGDPEQGETRPQSPGWSVARPDEAPAVPLQQQQQQ
jgi:transglutaminase-like putative cysteine protease